LIKVVIGNGLGLNCRSCEFESFYFVLENSEDAAIRSLRLDFELPRNFNNPERYRPAIIPDDLLRSVPNVVASAIFDNIANDVPIDPMTPFLYLKSKRLPEFVVAWFMLRQGYKRMAPTTRLFRAFHLLEAFRESVMYGEGEAGSVDGTGLSPASKRIDPGSDDREDEPEDE